MTGSVVTLASVAGPAQAATQSLFAAPVAQGAGDCSAPANACTVVDAVTAANAASVADDVRIGLAGGTYALASPLAVTFTGPSLTIEAESGTPTLDGGDAVQLLSTAAGTNVTVDGLTFRDGATGGYGGAIESFGTLTVKRSRLTGNTAGDGGAIAARAPGALTVEDSTLDGNTATSTIGGGIASYVPTTITRSTLSGNTAPVNGGGINLQPGAPTTITSSTLTGNVGNIGGAVYSFSDLTLQASTITGNSASSAAAVRTVAGVTFAATVVGPQTGGTACGFIAPRIDAGYTVDPDGTCISAATPAAGSHAGTAALESSTYAAAVDAYLADAAADNGGPTPTVAVLNTPNPFTTVSNPLFEVVPPTFTLPVAVEGESRACALTDQRGVLPVTGASCAIGAYLLQSTTTALTASADTIPQDGSVTYTATITPAADGGPVAFADGAGNPATSACAARPVTAGIATCTVAYPAAGDYQVAATYAGDGGGNSFKGSVSAPRALTVVSRPVVPPPPTPTPTPAPTATPTPDRLAPTSTVRRLTSVKQPITLRGTAADASGIRRVRVSVARKTGRFCRFLRADRTFSPSRSCGRTSYVNGTGTTSWTLKLPRLGSGTYQVWSRAIDTPGNVERKKSARNLRTFRIAAPARRAAARSAVPREPAMLREG